MYIYIGAGVPGGALKHIMFVGQLPYAVTAEAVAKHFEVVIACGAYAERMRSVCGAYAAARRMRQH
jgi:hypothetical protein